MASPMLQNVGIDPPPQIPRKTRNLCHISGPLSAFWSAGCLRERATVGIRVFPPPPPADASLPEVRSVLRRDSFRPALPGAGKARRPDVRLTLRRSTHPASAQSASSLSSASDPRGDTPPRRSPRPACTPADTATAAPRQSACRSPRNVCFPDTSNIRPPVSAVICASTFLPSTWLSLRARRVRRPDTHRARRIRRHVRHTRAARL